MSFADWDRNVASAFPVDPEFSSLGPATFDYLRRLRPPIQTVVVEEDYVDYDYSAAYHHFYSNLFRPPSRCCTRHLFFRNEFASVAQIQDQDNARSFAGFMVVWPTDPPVIGRTVLPFPTAKPGRQACVGADYEAHVAGVDLTLKSSAMFASKDHGVSVCATIASWLATDLMHRKFGFRTCSSSELTLLATGVDPKWGRPLPQSSGLDAQQIVRALYSLGYAPRVYYFDPQMGGPVETDRTWTGLLYGYILSRIPVIVMCTVEGAGPHSVLAVGLESSDLPTTGTRSQVSGRTFASAVKHILIHDDRWGAYSEMVPDPKDKRHARVGKRTVWIDGLIVPLPSQVNLFSGEAHRLGMRHLRRSIVRNLGEADYNGPFQTFLRQSTQFKRETLGAQWLQNQRVAARIRDLAMPKWIWVTEAYPAAAGSTENSSPIARAVYDATQLRFNKRDVYIIGHLFDSLLSFGEES